MLVPHHQYINDAAQWLAQWAMAQLVREQGAQQAIPLLLQVEGGSCSVK
jgi:hypothetical protein